MLSSITPFGERGRNARWWLTVSAFVVASMLGGAVSGSVFGIIGQALGATVDPSAAVLGALVVGVVGVALAFDLRGGTIPLPSWRRQVNEDWLTQYRGWIYGAGFGFQLGLGLVTFITAGAVYGTFGLALLSGSALGGLVIGLAFGLTRGLSILTTAGVRQPADLRSFHRRMQDWLPIAKGAEIAVQVVVMAVAVGAVVSA
jgi:hypothetical protein